MRGLQPSRPPSPPRLLSLPPEAAMTTPTTRKVAGGARRSVLVRIVDSVPMQPRERKRKRPPSSAVPPMWARRTTASTGGAALLPPPALPRCRSQDPCRRLRRRTSFGRSRRGSSTVDAASCPIRCGGSRGGLASRERERMRARRLWLRTPDFRTPTHMQKEERRGESYRFGVTGRLKGTVVSLQMGGAFSYSRWMCRKIMSLDQAA